MQRRGEVENVPQRLKPNQSYIADGTTELVPFPISLRERLASLRMTVHRA